MEVKAVIFDLDGTLVDTIEDIADANNRMLMEHGFQTHELNKYVEWIGNGARTLVEASLPPRVRNGNITAYLSQYNQYYRENISVKTKLFPKMEALLDLLTDNEIPMAIITNKPQTLSDVLVDVYFKKWNFVNVIGHSNHFPHKPDPTGALYFAEQVKCDPKNVLFIGDSYVDVETAFAAGMVPMGVNWGYGHPSMGGENIKIVDKPSEIIDFVKENVKCQVNA